MFQLSRNANMDGLDCVDLEAILEEGTGSLGNTGDVFADDTGEAVGAASFNLSGVSMQFMDELYSVFEHDDLLPQELLQTVRSTDRMALMSRLQFLDKCLVPKGKFLNATKELVYRNFHREYQLHMDEITKLTSPGAATWICLKAIELLVNKNYRLPLQTQQNASADVPSEEMDIVDYIGGFVVHKLKKECMKLSDTDQKTNMLECLTALTLTEEGSPCTTTSSSCTPRPLTHVMDRGGLVKIHPNISQVFCAMEGIFRACFNEPGHSLSFSKYLSECCQSDLITTCLFDQMYQVSVADTVKEKVFHGTVKCYFTIRAHHKCKTYMDAYWRTTQQAKKQKGLRKTLAAHD